jgi:GT2 family glycosyltransferase
VPQKNAGPAAARNNGFRQARGEYVLFIDDDVVPSPQLVAEHMRLQEGRSNLVVLGPMLSPPDFTLSPWVAWEQAMLEKQYAALQRGQWSASARQFYTGNTSLPRQALLESGGFDERFRRAEDIELAYRLEESGVEFMFTMAAVGHHYAERSLASWLQTPYAYGRHDVIFSRERHEWLLEFTYEEFKDRNIMIRYLVRLCLDRPRTSEAVLAITKPIASLSYRAGGGGRRIAQAAYSAIFNLRYYQGLSDELGGRKSFFGIGKAAAIGKPISS